MQDSHHTDIFDILSDIHPFLIFIYTKIMIAKPHLAYLMTYTYTGYPTAVSIVPLHVLHGIAEPQLIH
jgi:hypothetical protein